METQKGFAPLLVAIIVGVVLIAGGGVYYLSTKNERLDFKNLVQSLSITNLNSQINPKNEDLSETNKVLSSSIHSDWKTYKSTTYDYEIKYPSKYKVSWNDSPISADILGVDIASYVNENYDISFQIFARNGFVLDVCLKDLSGKDITKTIDVNGNKFYLYEDHKKGTGGRMALEEGAILSEYHAVHNGYCYIAIYTIVPSYPTSLSLGQLEEKIREADQVISTLKFTK